MPIDTSPSTVATSALQAIPYSALIGGPLDACIKAQATSAMTTVDFIKQVGFRKNEKGEPEVVNVVFQYVAEGQAFNLVVPLLAIVPIPYIGIDAITIDFKANIAAGSSSVNEETTATSFAGEATGGVSVGFGPFSVKVDFKASYSSKKDSKATQQSKYSVEYTMDVHVAASQSDMPAGLAKVLNILEANIARLNAKGTIEARPSSLVVGKDVTELPFEVRVLTGEGRGVNEADVKLKGVSAVSKLPAGTQPPAFTVDPQKCGEDGVASTKLHVPANPEPGSYTVTLEVTLPGKPATVRELALPVQVAKPA